MVYSSYKKDSWKIKASKQLEHVFVLRILKFDVFTLFFARRRGAI